MALATRREVLYGERVVPCFDPRPQTLDTILQSAVGRAPQRVALILGDKRISYAELDQTVEKIARNFVHAGLKKGDRIGILLGNCLEFVYLSLAANRAGLIAVLMNTRQRRPEIEFVLNQCKAVAVIYASDCEENLPDSVGYLPKSWVVGAGRSASYEELLAESSPVDYPAIVQEDVAYLLYTSGTTGNPKGAMLTHVSLIHSLINYREGFLLKDGDVSMLAVPASHVTGLVALILTTIFVTGTTIILSNFKAADFLSLAAKERMAFTLMVPAMYNLCLLNPDFANIDLASWRIAGFGGAPMPAATISRLRETLPNLKLCNVYGSTETSSPVTLLPPGSPIEKLASVGKPVGAATFVVVDDDGHEVAAGVDGELLIGGPMVVPGYWDNATATASGFVGGLWRSGDIGHLDEDGYVYVVDRKKDMINRAGFKVYCTEVENVMSHYPDIIESAVIGRPDPVLGERVHAFAYAAVAIAEADVKKYCAERLSDYKVPDTITFLTQPLPRNANGKIVKAELRAKLDGVSK